MRALRWRTLAGHVRTATLTKRSFDLDAVPTAGVRILTLPDGRRVGHLSLRSFVSDARSAGEAADLAALRNAFSQFAAKNVRDLIIDLRYNGGGLVSIAELLLNLLAGDRAGQVAFETRYNAAAGSAARRRDGSPRSRKPCRRCGSRSSSPTRQPPRASW